MPGMHASVITAATTRVAGPVPTDVSISHLGTPQQEAACASAICDPSVGPPGVVLDLFGHSVYQRALRDGAR